MSRESDANGDAHPQSIIQNVVGDAPDSPTVVPTRTETELTRKDSHTRNPARKYNFKLNPITVMKSNLTSKKKLKDPPPFWQGIKAILFATYLNVLLLCIPLSWAFHFALDDKPVIVFVFSFLAIIPLAKLLALATDEMSMRVGQTLAGLMNATLGNAVELIVAIIAVIKCQLQVVQSSLVGSILSNLLLVLGMCFFAGGTRFSEQGFGASASQINSSLLTISVIAVLLPAAFHFAISSGDKLSSDEESRLKKLSHGVAIILLIIYVSYLVFQLWSHANLYEDDHPGNFVSTPYDRLEGGQTRTEAMKEHAQNVAHNALDKLHIHPKSREPSVERSSVRSSARKRTTANGEATAAPTAGGLYTVPSEAPDTDTEKQKPPKEEGVEEPRMSLYMSIGLLAVVTVLVAVTAEFLVDSINGVTDSSSGLSKEWVGLILLPIVGNAAEHVTAVTVSVKDKLTLSIGVAVGSSIQIALFVIPFIVVLAWILGKPLLLLFDPFESVTLFLTIITVNYVVQDGKSNWLEGMILMCLYAIIAVSFWFYPGSNITSDLLCN